MSDGVDRHQIINDSPDTRVKKNINVVTANAAEIPPNMTTDSGLEELNIFLDFS